MELQAEAAASQITAAQEEKVICKVDKLVANSGVAALVDGAALAIFYLPDETPSVYALDNFDPFSQASVLSRGIVGDLKGELVVASPIYKQHFSLLTGQCLEDATVQVPSYPVILRDDDVVLLGS